MNLKQARAYPQTAIAVLLFILALANISWGDDKHKVASAPSAAPAKSAPAVHPSGGTASHGNVGRSGGGNTGRPSGGGANNGRPSNGNTGRPGAGYNAGKSNGRTNSSHGNVNSNNSGRPGSTAGNNGRNAGNGNNGRNIGAANNAKYGNAGNNGKKAGAENNNGKNAGAANNKYSGNGKNDRNPTAGNNGKNPGPSGPPRREAVRNVHEVGGRRIATDQRGRVRQINGRDSRGRELAIHRDFRGGTRFETRGAGGRRVVGYGHGRGFTERRFVNRGGRVYVQRTYVYGGRRYAYAYRSYYWHGNPYYGYAPAFYYHPAFYGWAYNPWATPVVYGWGWAGNPWYGYYGYYFTPYPSYTSASLWLTDYLLAENLRASYEARAEVNAAAMQQDANDPGNNGGGGGQVALSPEVKQMIADEVQRQLAIERSAAAQPSPAANNAPAQNANNQPEETPAALDPNQRVFIVAGNVDLVGDSGECAATAGDVLVRSGEPNGTKIGVSVVSSKKGDCAIGTNADVEIGDLQEMHNQFREKLDAGLKTMADNSGKNGLPKAPDTNTIGGEVPAPQPDADADGELQNQQKDAEGAEEEVQKTPGSPGGK